jgi:hypothetical protein
MAWYVMDKTTDVLVCSSRTRAEAYETRKFMAFIEPNRKFKVVRFF